MLLHSHKIQQVKVKSKMFSCLTYFRAKIIKNLKKHISNDLLIKYIKITSLKTMDAKYSHTKNDKTPTNANKNLMADWIRQYSEDDK